MSRVTVTASFPAPPQRVWDVIADPSTYDRWLTIHTSWKGDVPKRFEKGATAQEVVTMLGMANTITWTVEQLDEPTTLRIAGTGMAGVRTAFTLGVASDGNGGATATIDAEFEGQLVTGALGKAVEQDAKANLDRSLANLAGLVTA